VYNVISVIYLILVGFDGMFAYSLCIKVELFLNLTIVVSGMKMSLSDLEFFVNFSLEVKIIKECEDYLVMIFKRCIK